MSGQCEECGQASARYKCPRCGLRSCGVACVKAHKTRIGCTGKRDPTSFVSLSNFDDNRLVADYNFLEEVLRVADVAKRTKYLASPGRGRPNFGAIKELAGQAKYRKINFVYMAHGMSKRIANTTYFNRRRKCMYWRVEWIFYSTDVRVVDECLDEHVKLGDVLEKHLSPPNHSPIVRHRLQEFLEQPRDQLKLLFKKEHNDGKECYYELNVNQSLRQQLSFKTVIEFPEIKVVLPSDVGKFSIIEDPVPPKVPASPVKSVEGEAVMQAGKTFREEEIKEDDETDMYDLLEDLPGEALSLWKSLKEFQPPSLTKEFEDGEVSC